MIIDHNLDNIRNVSFENFKRMEVKKYINRIHFRIVELKNYTNKFVITESLKIEVEDLYRDFEKIFSISYNDLNEDIETTIS